MLPGGEWNLSDPACIVLLENAGIQGIVIDNTELMKGFEPFVFRNYGFFKLHHYVGIEGIPEIHQGCVIRKCFQCVARDDCRIGIFIEATSCASCYSFIQFYPVDRRGTPIHESPVKYSAPATSDIHKNIAFNQYLLEQDRYYSQVGADSIVCPESRVSRAPQSSGVYPGANIENSLS